MFSRVADALRRDQRQAERALAPLERLELARRLGDEAVAAFARARGLTSAAAAAELARRRRLGRRFSACAEGR